MSTKKELSKKTITPKQVPEDEAKRALKFLNTLKTISETASTIELTSEHNIGLRVARNIQKERTKLWEFTGLTQLADTSQVEPERFSESVLSLDLLKRRKEIYW